MDVDGIDEFWDVFMFEAFRRDRGSLERIFRGVKDKRYDLIPSLARGTKNGTHGDILSLEDALVREFKRLSIRELDSVPDNEFEWVFLAQHYGLPTRLLDWSTNPLVALYFASEGKDEVDGALYIARRMVSDQYDLFDYKTAHYTNETKKLPVSAFALYPTLGEVLFVRPRYSDRRYQNQKSVFSCAKDPFKPLTDEEITKIEFPGALKPAIRSRLRSMGVSSSFIYPGLAGIATEVKSFLYAPVVSGAMQIITARMDE